MRAPYQILVFPYHIGNDGKIQYCIFKRKDLKIWQGIAGGGEDNELPIETARRESFEEAGIINRDHFFVQLDSVASIPAEAIGGLIWEKDVLVVPEYSFGIEVTSEKIQLQNEHSQYAWLSYEQAIKELAFDSNKIALKELHRRLTSQF